MSSRLPLLRAAWDERPQLSDANCYPASSKVDANHDNPCSLVGNSLFPTTGKSPARTSRNGESETLASPGSPDFGVFPCIFPANQGSAPRDEFATDCAHRHSVALVHRWLRRSHYWHKNPQ
jgi:streptogramin lyase